MVGLRHAGGPGGLHAVDLDFGAQALDGERHPGDQPPAADRHDDGVHIGQLVQDLQPDGPLPRDDQFVVIRVDEGHAGLLLQFHRPVMGVVIGAPDQFHLGPQPLGALHFHQGRAVGHADHAADAHAGGRQRHALGMVARRAGDDAFGPFFGCELADLIVSAPHLETAGDLQVLGFQVEVGVGAQVGRCDQIGLAGHLLENESGMIDLVQCQHAPFPFHAPNSTARPCAGPGFGPLPCSPWRMSDYS